MPVNPMSLDGQIARSTPCFDSIRTAQYQYNDGSHVGGVQALQAMSLDARYGAPLPPEAGELMDDLVIRVGSDNLELVKALIEAGLVKPLPDWWGWFTIQHLKAAKFGRARVSMLPGGEPDNNARPDVSPVSTPVYAVEEDFSWHERFLQASQNSGFAIDEESMMQALENANETIEDVAFNSIEFTVPGTLHYGLLTAPDANTVTWSGSNKAWDHASKTGQEIFNDLLAMKASLRNDKKLRGAPLLLALDPNYEEPLEKSFSDGTTTDHNITVREKLLVSLGEGGKIIFPDYMPDDRGALIRMHRDTVDVVRGQDPTWVPFGVRRYKHEFEVLACMITRWKSDASSNSGVVLGNV